MEMENEVQFQKINDMEENGMDVFELLLILNLIGMVLKGTVETIRILFKFFDKYIEYEFAIKENQIEDKDVEK